MPPQQLTPAAVVFLTQYVASIEELETLMLLVASSSQWWDAQTASRQLGIPARRARAALDALAARNLLEIRITEEVRFQFRPGSGELEHAALAVAEAYRANPAPVAQIVGGATQRSVSNPAGSFSLRRL